MNQAPFFLRLLSYWHIQRIPSLSLHPPWTCHWQVSHLNLCSQQVTRCHAPNMFGAVNMEHTIDLSLSWSKQ